MYWQKLGLIFQPTDTQVWMHTHAMIPIAQHLKEDIFRIYYSVRDHLNRSHGAWIDIDLNSPKTILAQSVNPVLEPGELGCFDDSGALPNSLVIDNDRTLLYYTGINLGVTVKIRNSIGVAEWNKESESFMKLYKGPIIDRTKDKPHFVATPHVLKDGKIFKAWFTSCQRWTEENNFAKHYYNIEYAESEDGINWRRDFPTAIDFQDMHEYALGVPRVIKGAESWEMWFCARATRSLSTYRIYYARSTDGIIWKRYAEPCIPTSSNGWDSQMTCYPFVFDHKDERFMLYNGNYYGLTGIGLAKFISQA